MRNHISQSTHGTAKGGGRKGKVHQNRWKGGNLKGGESAVAAANTPCPSDPAVKMTRRGDGQAKKEGWYRKTFSHLDEKNQKKGEV